MIDRKRLLFEPSDKAKRFKAANDLSSSSVVPIDLSGKKSDEVITLSDDEEEEIQSLAARVEKEGLNLHEEQESMIRKLQASLRNEESKLFLLKSLRHYQKQSTCQSTPAVPSGAPTATTSAASSKEGTPTPGSLNSSSRPSLNNLTANSSAARNLSRPSITKATSSSQLSSTKPPPLHSSPATTKTPQITASQLNDLKAQKKLALRKQLEKSLLEISNPQPPPSELNFIPSTATNEFIALVGLEEVVKNIAEHESMLKGSKPAEVKYVIHPFSCVQCDTDYTPVWKRDKPGSKNVICEACVSTNQKNQIKKEHTARLKACFVKALKQEDEIEKDFKKYASNPTAAAQAFPHLVPTQSATSTVSASSSTVAASNITKSASSASLSGQRGTGNTSTGGTSSVSSQQSAAAMTAEFQRQQAQLFQVAQLQAMGQFFPGATGRNSVAFPYSMPASYLNMLQQAARSQGMNFNSAAASLWSAIANQQQQQSRSSNSSKK